MEDYKRSSYYGYYLFYNDKYTNINGEVIKEYLNTYEEFDKFMNSCNEDECLEYKMVSNFNDNTIRDTICKEYCISNLLELPINERNKIINDTYKKKYSSIRQLSRVFGIGKAMVERTVKQDR